MITYKPIGIFETEFNKKSGAPRQGKLLENARGVIVLNEEFKDALDYLSSFEYIWVLFHFDKADSWDNKVNPPDSEHVFGVFATRSPRRPNPLGLSLVKLERIIENKLYINHADAFDGTPVIDIKPYLPSIDTAVSRKNTNAENFLGHHDNIYMNSLQIEEFIEGKKKNK
ncbi:MAG: tRNA (N6-threonylcarbamoyladenosine(37)-N6)-methyltransferase TrmO [Chlorobi bacterium]|nr:tRNA (N6-threonylcarbamoyladenosine(37)-N6)-methyltransferase TrmO [Chlorobiota bacterium]